MWYKIKYSNVNMWGYNFVVLMRVDMSICHSRIPWCCTHWYANMWNIITTMINEKIKKKCLSEIERLYRSRSKIMMIYIIQRLTLNLRDKSFTKFSYILILKKIWNRNQKLMTTHVRAQHKHRVFMNRTRRSAVLPYGQ